MKHIVIPTDFSENSKNAAVYAMHLFKDTPSTFYFLHTYSPAIYTYDYQLSSGIYGNDVYKAIKDNVTQELNTFTESVKQLFNNPKHTFVTVTVCNTFLDEIRSFVKEKNADLIVMGTKGASASKEVLFGSNAVHVINKVKCPVLAVPNTYDFTDLNSVTLPLNYEEDYDFVPPKSILFPTDYKLNYNTSHLELLKTIATIYGAQIHVLHVSHGELDDVAQQHQDTLKSALNDFNVEYIVVNDQDIPDAVYAYQSENDTQLLMMINNKHSFFENLFFRPVISKLGMHLSTPFLVIPS